MCVKCNPSGGYVGIKRNAVADELPYWVKCITCQYGRLEEQSTSGYECMISVASHCKPLFEGRYFKPRGDVIE